jgi:arylsulfatase A-like enzyme
VKSPNFLFILSDQHHRLASGCYGHPLVQTPHLDSLAARGTRFQNAYTNCPICVPARASLATGRYVHQLGYWDNGHPYDGTPVSCISACASRASAATRSASCTSRGKAQTTDLARKSSRCT